MLHGNEATNRKWRQKYTSLRMPPKTDFKTLLGKRGNAISALLELFQPQSKCLQQYSNYLNQAADELNEAHQKV